MYQNLVFDIFSHCLYDEFPAKWVSKLFVIIIVVHVHQYLDKKNKIDFNSKKKKENFITITDDVMLKIFA
jgi:hypothetical protein